MRLGLVAFLLLTALTAACDDAETKRKRLQAEQAAEAAAASRVAEERLRSTARNIAPAARLRGVVAHRQAQGGYAVCGQVNLTGAVEDPYLPFVSVVSPNGERVEQFVATGSAEATRTYVETNTRCFDGGGPTSARSVPPLPPVPATATPPPAAPAPAPAQAPAQAPPPAPPPAGSPSAQGSVTTTSAHPVNLRSSPAGGGAVLRVVPRGTRLRVFAEAPGGWYQVGEGEPAGWIHGSMLERP
ncbi:SH3 domain-containing protein [Pararoseomonas sp. SCSIO 73927]|uniref:SH3 domain-containing protein n=1 Tax=Pararoseomonas sp. SCSIO 73927 TaxID=3114537 RepID=UPI0030CCF172